MVQKFLPPTPGEKAEAQRSATSEIVEAMQVVSQIQNEAREQARPADKAEQPSMLEIIRTVREMMPAPAPPATENKMLETVLALMTKQIDTAAADNRKLRKEISDMRNNPEKKGGALGTLKEIVAEAKGLLPDLKEMFPNLGQTVSGAARAVRSNMGADQEFWQPIVTKIIDAVAPAAPMFIAKLMTPKPPGQQPQQPGPQAHRKAPHRPQDSPHSRRMDRSPRRQRRLSLKL